MVSSDALIYQNARTTELIQKKSSDKPFIVQIAGNKVENIKKAVEILNDIEYINGIDLNVGCPARKIVNHGSGSALLGNLSLLENMLETMKIHSTKPISLKIRLGLKEKVHLEVAKIVNRIKPNHITIHARTTKDGYNDSKIDYKSIANFREVCNEIPIVANGCIKNFVDALNVKKITGVDSLMIGRGAIGRPWVFYMIKNEIDDEVDNNMKKDIILKHLDNMVDFYGQRGVIIFRKHLHTYSKGIRNSKEFRDIVNKTASKGELSKIIKDYFI